jgi:hypothetical protein
MLNRRVLSVPLRKTKHRPQGLRVGLVGPLQLVSSIYLQRGRWTYALHIAPKFDDA